MTAKNTGNVITETKKIVAGLNAFFSPQKGCIENRTNVSANHPRTKVENRRVTGLCENVAGPLVGYSMWYSRSCHRSGTAWWRCRWRAGRWALRTAVPGRTSVFPIASRQTTIRHSSACTYSATKHDNTFRWTIKWDARLYFQLAAYRARPDGPPFYYRFRPA